MRCTQEQQATKYSSAQTSRNKEKEDTLHVRVPPVEGGKRAFKRVAEGNHHSGRPARAAGRSPQRTGLGASPSPNKAEPIEGGYRGGDRKAPPPESCYPPNAVRSPIHLADFHKPRLPGGEVGIPYYAANHQIDPNHRQ